MGLNNYLRSAWILCLFIGTAVYGQSGIHGRITDANNETLTGAVVELRTVKDSTLAKVNVTDAEGQYQFSNVTAGDYFLKASLLGFTPFKGHTITVDGTSEKEIPVIKLEVSAVQLK